MTVSDTTGQPIYSFKKEPNTHLETTIKYLLPMTKTNWEATPTIGSPYFVLLGFLWPMAVIFLSAKAKFRRIYLVFFGLESVALIYAGLVLYTAGWLFNQPLSGAYIGAAGVLICAIVWMLDLVRMILARWAVRG